MLAAVRELARREKTTIGKVISGLARRSLTAAATPVSGDAREANKAGIRPLPTRGALVTNEAVERLRDEEGI